MTATEAAHEAVVKEEVSFEVNGARLAGNLFRPKGGTGTGGLPGVVVTGTWTSVKEQMADRYAAALAARGFAALSFDPTGFGASGGEPRDVESVRLKTTDIAHAAAFLGTHPVVEGAGVGALAICASAMYAAAAAASGTRLQALALVAPWLHDAGLVREVYGGEPGVQAKLHAADRASKHYEQTGVVDYVPVADPDDPEAAMPMEIDFYTNPHRGRIAGWPNRFAVMAWREWLTLDAVALAPNVTIPTLIVHSQSAAIPNGARRFYEGLRCPRELVWMPGTQFDFYDDPPTVERALDHAVRHLRHHLNHPSATRRQP